MKRSVLPLILVLIAAPFFANYREQPLRFGILQGVLIVLISIFGSGGVAAFKVRLKNPVFALFWSVILALAVSAPFLIQYLKI